ncbi:hypothetical protein AB0F88_39920 [Streptosporangium sp. NPDC023963]|uniref:hypothetical protein n=1 Tax=Streptosporangium sp. NPDC023963 TaxID=3155608 RepID=UPI00342D903C
MPDDLRQRYARLENEQGQLWDIVDQVHLGPVSPDKDLVEAVADTIKQVGDVWQARAEEAGEALESAQEALTRVVALARSLAATDPATADLIAETIVNMPGKCAPGAALALLDPPEPR